MFQQPGGRTVSFPSHKQPLLYNIFQQKKIAIIAKKVSKEWNSRIAMKVSFPKKVNVNRMIKPITQTAMHMKNALVYIALVKKNV